MTFHRSISVIGLLLALSACDEFPELDAAASDQAKKAPYPELVPTARITSQATVNQITLETSESVQGQSDGLQQSAGGLNQSPSGVNEALETRIESLQERAERLREQE
ncbi:hypothetical protein ROA7450_00365 [Roseovarius albus]|uniref:Lipoprotein n=1 Tax=Roseovarius albus TaxID=1247867 RepID=A0A1X6YB41_9RHOB|nr:hypothetical protein [Roseovarius albus]SLN15618.1 hypothetical protein ROA7450_00365 [Roseovarius albus]